MQMKHFNISIYADSAENINVITPLWVQTVRRIEKITYRQRLPFFIEYWAFAIDAPFAPLSKTFKQ